MLKTEMRNEKTTHIDKMDTYQMLEIIQKENENAVRAVSKAINSISETIDIVKSFVRSVTERNVEIAKEKLISSLIMSREQPQSKLSAMGHSLLFHGRFIEDDEIIEKIKKVELSDVITAAEKYLKLSEMSFTAVGRVKTESEYRRILENSIG